ncbi:acyloxyacyl hydrolase [Terracidiphilus sp.]|jgi:hypothetical protein|uniref:acyloxyacyl hydrolase n=1 Tax=Terracidiphilus sp. TaxID=1964191 RepID=UPI003C1A4D1F
MKKTIASCAFLICFHTIALFGQQENRFDFRSSYGVTTTYSSNSSHILIGISEGREITTAGFEYTHRLLENGSVKLEYAGEVSPLYRESDPAITGYTETYDGITTFYPTGSARVVLTHGGSPPEDCITYYPTCVPVNPVPGPNEITYGFATAPLGSRVILRPRKRVQPTFLTNVGMVFTQRTIPVDEASSINFQFSFGPGVQVFVTKNYSFRIEYLYRHISNADIGLLNPGIDQGVFRITLSRHR